MHLITSFFDLGLFWNFFYVYEKVMQIWNYHEISSSNELFKKIDLSLEFHSILSIARIQIPTIFNCMIGYHEFRRNVEILKNLQKKLISILSCQEMLIPLERENLFNYFNEISLSKNFPLYEGFIRIFVHLSIYFNIKEHEKNEEILKTILTELISKHSLKESFHPTTLFFLFKENVHLIYFLFKEAIFDFSLIETEVKCAIRQDFFLFFIPEIKKMNPELYLLKMKEFRLKEKDINDFYFKSLEKSEELTSELQKFDFRKNMHSQEEIAKIIRSDDIDSFIEYVSNHDNYDLNSKVMASFLENNSDINNKVNSHDGLSLFEYSMGYGSVNIFRYLWEKKVEYTDQSLKYCVIGGNSDILRILEEESKYKFNEECYYTSIQYYHPKITEHFQNLLKIPPLTIPSIFSTVHRTTNLEFFWDWLILNENSNEENLQQSQIFNFLTKSASEPIDAYKLLVSEDSNNFFLAFYFFYLFILQQSNIDINSFGKICFLINCF
ncbi:hypothetical protein TRFO_07648 [Tritrichomonas foetus]|uniref:DUF3447 domain-containing protein n=1 Tax=Tritrichomonas foetus TaxID=1144522 RepID=A0A1J4JQG5_9EUKA|nr:hypothetical protein TRFO_07648 [Tritrichomonas foetus]|eukprot:OHT00994.1 hypothetical protein TRFO_07648 [Tritrichomonas foetus]